MQFLNLGILAHVDAGKTSLTERLLHDAGVIDELGSVDAGNTQTDTLALERRRGITIKSAVVAFAIDDVAVNLIDTPGHPDFIAEVERVLRVLDGAVLVVSAVEGVQAQTRVLMRTLKRLRIPTLFFVNKTDRRGADPARVRARSRASCGSRRRRSARRELAELLADHDDAFLAAYLDGGARWREELAAQTAARARAPACSSGSAITGAGVDELDARHPRPAAPRATAAGPPPAPCSRSSAATPVRSRDVHARARCTSASAIGDEKVTAISVFEPGGTVATRRAARGPDRQGLRARARADRRHARRGHGRRRPLLRAPDARDRRRRATSDRVALHLALTELAEQDPLINLRRDGDELAVSLYGEVQKEVIEATLADEYGLAVRFRETTTIRFEQARRHRRGGRVHRRERHGTWRPSACGSSPATA